VTVYVPTQAPFETREQLTKVLDLPREKIRVVATPLGGGFGGKLEIALEGMASVAAWVTRKPVKIVLNRSESLRTSVKRHPFELDYRVATDGRRRPPRGRCEDDLRRRTVHRQQPARHRPGEHLLVRPVSGPERPHRRQGRPHQQPARWRVPRLRHQPGRRSRWNR